jgi:hypothetical protein
MFQVYIHKDYIDNYTVVHLRAFVPVGNLEFLQPLKLLSRTEVLNSGNEEPGSQPSSNSPDAASVGTADMF